MGKVIITEGRYSKTPYLLMNSKLKIHSIEELVYCILKNPELCEDFLYDHDLAQYIDKELGLKERASLLDNLIERDAPLRDLVTVCFCSCDYLVREEIEDFVNDMLKVEGNEKWVRFKNKADSYLQHENYKNALINYRNLVKDSSLYGITTETLGDIYHNMGIATLHTEGFRAAAECFRIAYEKNGREESLKSYLLALKFLEDSTEYKEALDIYNISEEMALWLNTAYFHTELEADNVSGMFELNEAAALLKEGKILEFNSEIEKMVSKIKKDYRKYNE